MDQDLLIYGHIIIQIMECYHLHLIQKSSETLRTQYKN